MQLKDLSDLVDTQTGWSKDSYDSFGCWLVDILADMMPHDVYGWFRWDVPNSLPLWLCARRCSWTLWMFWVSTPNMFGDVLRDHT